MIGYLKEGHNLEVEMSMVYRKNMGETALSPSYLQDS